MANQRSEVTCRGELARLARAALIVIGGLVLLFAAYSLYVGLAPHRGAAPAAKTKGPSGRTVTVPGDYAGGRVMVDRAGNWTLIDSRQQAVLIGRRDVRLKTPPGDKITLDIGSGVTIDISLKPRSVLFVSLHGVMDTDADPGKMVLALEALGNDSPVPYTSQLLYRGACCDDSRNTEA